MNIQISRSKERLIGILQVIIGSMVIMLLMLFSSCNPYKQIAKKSPESLKDSSRLAQRYKRTFPPANDKKSDTVTIVKEGKVNQALLKHISDSISLLKAKGKKAIEIKYRDTCTSAVTAYNEAMEVGFEQGYYVGSHSKPDSVLEITKTITNTITDHSAITIERDLRTNAEKQLEIEKTKKERNWTAIKILSGLLVICGVGLYFTIKKTGKLTGLLNNK